MKWKYKGLTPANGEIYHKGNNIMIVYINKIKLYKNVPSCKFLPCFSECCIIREKAPN